MFGRKSKDGADGTDKQVGGVDDSLEAQKGRALARLSTEYDDRVSLNETGKTGMSTVLAIESGPAADRLVEERIKVGVKADAGEEFEATIVQARIGGLAAGQPTTTVGARRRVVFDPSDHSHVEWRLDSALRPVRWHVPSTCPTCGAAVGQSTAALAEHPECDHCHQPLPVDPVG